MSATPDSGKKHHCRHVSVLTIHRHHEHGGSVGAPDITRLLSLRSSGTATADTGIASALTGVLGGIGLRTAPSDEHVLSARRRDTGEQ